MRLSCFMILFLLGCGSTSKEDPLVVYVGSTTPTQPDGGPTTTEDASSVVDAPEPRAAPDMETGETPGSDTESSPEVLPSPKCLGGGDCTKEYPVCFQGACIECLQDDQCSPGKACTDHACVPYKPPCGGTCPVEKPYCLEDQCVECLKLDHCQGGEVCMDHTCLVYECESDAYCETGVEVCVNYACVIPECFSVKDCPDGQVCHNNTCAVPQSCATTSECLFGSICIEGTCIPSECGSDDDCGLNAPICWFKQGLPNKCVQCLGGKGCLDGVEVCVENSCIVPACWDDKDCPAGQWCVTWQGAPKCVQCNSDVQCKAGEVCEGDFCTPSGEAPCDDFGQCPEGTKCKDKFCVEIVGTPCGPNSPCFSGQGCNAGICMPLLDCNKFQCDGPTPKCNQYYGCVECLNSTHCKGGATCIGGKCDYASMPCGAACEDPTPVCYEDQCVECVTSATCQGDKVCLNNACIVYNCASDTDCSGGDVCIGYNCVPPGSTLCDPKNPTCPDGQGCKINVCVPAANCATLTCASPTPFCDPFNGGCVECVVHADCTGANWCSEGVCIVKP